MKIKNSFLAIAVMTLLSSPLFAFSSKSHDAVSLNASAQTLGNDFFSDDYSGDALDTAYTCVYTRGASDNTVDVSNGECIASINNGHFGTTKSYSTYVCRFAMYNATEARVQIMFGNSNPSSNHAVGANTTSDSYAIILTNSFYRVYNGGAQIKEQSITTGITNTSYSYFCLVVTSSRVELKINNKVIYETALASALPAGQILFSKPNSLPVYHFDYLSVSPLDYSFNETFANANNTEMSFYNRSSATMSVADGTSTVTLNNDNYATTGYYGDFSAEVVMKNTSEARIAFTIGGPTSPSSTGYAAYNNMSSGLFRVIIMASAIRWLENNSTSNQVNISTGISTSSFSTIKFSVKERHFALTINNTLIFEKDLASTFVNPGQIIFHRGDSATVTNYVFDSISVRNFNLVELSTNVNLVNERYTSNYEQNSLLRFDLSTSDYSSLSETNVNSYRSYLDSLNTKDYVRINGEPLSSDNVYLNGDRFINLGTSKGTYAVRTSGNQTGCFYMDNGTKVFTDDLCIYEVEIKKGCQFPKYGSLVGTDDANYCYVTERDFVFIWRDGEFHLSDTFNYPVFESCSITNTSIVDKGGANKSLNIQIDNFDWPTQSTGFDNLDVKNQIPCKNLQDHIVFVDKTGNYLTPASYERFINLWGAGTDKPTFSIRMPNTEITNISAIMILKGAEFPSYEEYEGTSHKVFKLSKSVIYYSSGDSVFYKATDLSSTDYAQEFFDAMGEVCTTYGDGNENTRAKLVEKFDIFKKIYDENLSSSVKSELLNSTDDIVLDMIERYSFVVKKYGLTNFLGLYGVNSSNFIDLLKNNVTAQTGILITLAVVGSTAIVCLLISKRRKGAIK